MQNQYNSDVGCGSGLRAQNGFVCFAAAQREGVGRLLARWCCCCGGCVRLLRAFVRGFFQRPLLLLLCMICTGPSARVLVYSARWVCLHSVLACTPYCYEYSYYLAVRLDWYQGYSCTLCTIGAHFGERTYFCLEQDPPAAHTFAPFLRFCLCACCVCLL